MLTYDLPEILPVKSLLHVSTRLGVTVILSDRLSDTESCSQIQERKILSVQPIYMLGFDLELSSSGRLTSLTSETSEYMAHDG
jgi:hypothetical protein